MDAAATTSTYRPTEAKYKGGAEEKYVTYDLDQKTRGGGTATYPKVKRVYIAGDIKDWRVGRFQKRSGREVHGVKIDYEQTRAGYRRKAYGAERAGTHYDVSPAAVAPSTTHFTQIVEVPEDARNVRFHDHELPERYRAALQNVR
jgi:hypothetical protein